MPCHLDPDPHNHGRHPIAYNDHVKHPVDCADYHDHEQQPDRPVKFDQQHLDRVRSFAIIERHRLHLTVADLLDVYDTDDFSAIDVVSRSSDDDRESANRIFTALVAFRALSPEERAEFDRRTT